MKKILIVDDHPVIASGVLFLLKKNLHEAEVVIVTSADAFRKAMRKDHFDLVILDVMLPKTDTQGLVINMVALYPDRPILMYSSCNEEIYAIPYMKLGAKGYLHKSATDEELMLAINTLLSGNIFISHKAMNGKPLFNWNKDSNPFLQLSKRELEVLTQLLAGKSVKEISEDMNLGQSTIATQKSRILTKLQVNNIIDLVKLAEQYGIINGYTSANN